MADIFKKAYRVIGLGEFGENSHPVHPATVHYPIAFLSLTCALKVLYGTSLYLSIPFTADRPNLSSLAILSYSSNLLGVVTAIPSLVTGICELYAMVSANGLYKADEKTGQKNLIPKVKTTFIHAGLNDLVIGMAIYNWMKERSAPDFAPESHQIVLAALSLPGLLYAAYLGGGLVYTRGVGVQRMGSGLEEKRKTIEQANEKKK